MSSPDQNSSKNEGGVALVFAKAYENFRNGLSDEEKKVFTDFANAEALVTSIRGFAEQHHINESRITTCCKAVSDAGQRLMPYFRVVDIFVSSHPEYAALLWGAIRLMFELGMNYAAFLEKFCAMLEQATGLLPSYESLYKRIELLNQERAKNKSVGKLSPRLPEWLSLIYVDILQFCQEACNILSGKRGIRAKTKLVWNLSWRPFDVRFGQIIERFKEHKQLIDNEARIAQLEVSADHYVEFRNELLEAERRRQEDDDRRKEKEQKALDKRIREIKQWIDPPEWEIPYEDVCNRRCEGTGEWLFSESVFRTWEEDLRAAWASSSGNERKLLLIQGKPGYGKTYLCALLIQRYREAKQSLCVGGQKDTVPDAIFYFFDKRNEGKAQKATSAFKAMLTQMIHLHSEDRYTLDMASIFLSGAKQTTATKTQVLNLLHWYLKEYPRTVLVIDGLDESEDPKEVLSGLTPTYGSLVTAKSDGKTGDGSRTPAVAIFMRPDTPLSRLSRASYHRLRLQDSHNSEDVGTFLFQQFSAMDVLADLVNLDDAVKKATIHANGMFLWAKLLVEYLESDFLCDEDISSALENMVRLEGLDALYAAIFSSLQTRRTGPARENSKRTFEWVTCSHRPLHIEELAAAVSISGFREISEISKIKRFEESLGPASGALLEVAQDKTVHFIHTSVKEFLISGTEQSFIRYGTGLELDMAARCLFYLTKCIPSGPLSGDSQMTPDKTIIQEKFPLVRYSVESWHEHSLSGIEALAQKGWPISTMESSLEAFVKQLSALLLNKEAATTWIEASWLFNVPPTVPGLSQFARSALSEFRVSETIFNELSHIDEHLAQLEFDLLELNQEWGNTLRETPNEIWEPSISAFNDFSLWMKMEDAHTRKLRLSTESGDDSSISLRSQVSADGTELGVLRLCAPRAFRTGLSKDMRRDVSLSDWAAECAGNWTAMFDVWSLQDDTVKFRIVLNLPSEDIEPWLVTWATKITTASPTRATQGWEEYSDWWFASAFLDVPCAIAPDLRKILILGCIAVVDRVNTGTRSEHSYGTSDGCKLKVKCFRPWFSTRGRRCKGSTPTGMKLKATTSAERKVEKEHNERLSVYQFGALFAPSGNALLLLRPTLECNVEQKHDPFYSRDPRRKKPKQPWDLTVFSDLTQPTWKQKTISQFSVISGNAVHKLDEFCTFHPVLPVLVFPTSKLCRMWCFESSDAKSVIDIVRDRLKHPAFSACGHYLHGENSSYEFRMLNVDDALNKILPVHYQSHAQVHTKGADSVTRGRGSESFGIGKIGDQMLPATQTSNSIHLGRNESGVATVSMLTHLKEENALILRTYREDGVAVNETLTRIPERLKLSDPVNIRPSENESSDSIRLVFNVTRRDHWTIYDAMRETDMPIILERTKKSIPLFIGKITQTIQDSSSND